MVATLVVVGPVAVVAGLVVAAVPVGLVVVVVVPWGLGPQRHQPSHRGEVIGIVIG
jgi:hypothetical protein